MRKDFCGPVGEGPFAQFLSKLVSDKPFGIYIGDLCRNHDIDWADGPDTIDDLVFSYKVFRRFTRSTEFKHKLLSLPVGLVAFTLVRITAVVYKKRKK